MNSELRFQLYRHKDQRAPKLISTVKTLSPNSTSLDIIRFVLSSRVVTRRDVTCRACSNMADQEAMVIACTSVVFCALAYTPGI